MRALFQLRYRCSRRPKTRLRVGSPSRYLTCTVARWLNTSCLPGAKPEHDQPDGTELNIIGDPCLNFDLGDSSFRA